MYTATKKLLGDFKSNQESSLFKDIPALEYSYSPRTILLHNKESLVEGPKDDYDPRPQKIITPIYDNPR